MDTSLKDKVILYLKYIIIGFVTALLLLSLLPFVMVDKHSCAIVEALYNEYRELYTNGDDYEYGVVMQSALDTGTDFLAGYKYEDLAKSNRYQIENNVVKLWNDLNYNGKDRLLKKVSKIMQTFDYAPATAASELAMLSNSKMFMTFVSIKAIMYQLRFRDTVFYVAIILLLCMAELSTIRLLFFEDYVSYLDSEDDYDDDDSDIEYKGGNNDDDY